MNIFTRGSVNFIQQPRSNLTEALEQCYKAPGAMLRSCWRNIPKGICKNRKTPISG